MEEELYYTPKITDIRVGYVCQCSDGMKTGGDGEIQEQWYVFVVTPKSSLETIDEMIKEGRLRARYVVLPDLINTEWFCEGKIENIDAPDKPTNLYRFTKGRYWMIYDFVAKVVMIALTMGDVHSVCVQRFNCPSMNEFLYIEANLNLH